MTAAHTDVGAYALGLLEADDQRAFEEHLGDCGSCSAELSGFAGMRRLLEGIGPVEVDEEPEDLSAGITDLISRRRQADRRRRVGTTVIGLAAGVAIVAGGVTVGSAVVSGGSSTHQHGSPAADVLAHGERHTATDPNSHAAAIVAVRPAAFGTEVGLDLAKLHGPLTCRLVAVTRSGQQQPVTEWAVPPKGYGVPGSPAHLQVHGGVAAPRADIVRLDVIIEGGRRLVSVPI
jgi:hypothetical protein